MNLRRMLESRLQEGMARAGLPADAPAMVAPAARKEFGDYQANGVMGAAKRLKTNPRKLAEQVVAACDLADLAEKVEIAGPGFINITLSRAYVNKGLAAVAADERLGVDKPAKPQRVVIDYSGPNLAKEMHVGHLRSTIIGDALARTLEFQGHQAIRQNHIGDWGTQFGMLLAYQSERLRAQTKAPLNSPKPIPNVPAVAQPMAIGQIDFSISDWEDFYRQAKKRFDEEPEFADLSRHMVVELQRGNASVHRLWESVLDESLKACKVVYNVLGVTLTDGDIRGESAYNEDLPKVVEDLQKAGLLTESQGAQCVFLPQFQAKDGSIQPLIVQKTDEGYLYATTDLAAMRYRVGELHADRILYVVDARQSLHFQQVFAVARKAGFVSPEVSLEHIGFGTMMGADGKPFKTRSGDLIKLMDLLNEAEQKAYALVAEKTPELSEEDRRRIARAVGIGAVKYSDLSQNRSSDYVFSWDKMLSLNGNTAPYMQYAYARIASIFRKGAELAGVERSGSAGIEIAEPAERALAVKILQFPEVIETVAADCLPNLLCAYLYDLAGAFMGFYESCPVLQSADPVRSSRLALCTLTARTVQTGLNLLGIDTIERM